jgi:hypothetical protein
VFQNWSHVLGAPRRPGAPVSFGRYAPDQVRDMAAEPVGWTSGELPGQVTAWPPGPRMAPDQPPASA